MGSVLGSGVTTGSGTGIGIGSTTPGTYTPALQLSGTVNLFNGYAFKLS